VVESSIPFSDRRTPLLLLVEDDLDTRTLFAECLTNLGFRVHVARNGNEGLQVALAEPPDVVVLDLAMPQLDGWETARLLRCYTATDTIPIVAFTARTDPQDVARAREAGCVRVVAKPCTPERLESVVRETLPTVARHPTT
jgi:two-component system cell cycle response regulator DivK